ncbi:hypothetical protein AAMO2058_001151700 [Amorphochlora amoebiformis]|uniref:Thiamine pyrimidine synthase n=1 Tax=Amorphochlora amoebiformis TaxID=1561963 RepID=A0A7S0CUB4_9EUKA|mmetsp:Transcript_13598/g.21493  ORF Transcript_13598/g.21493 Transcript_13598/m.21493 type:complete len:327 (+) Transcript_13598:33-1013(+)
MLRRVTFQLDYLLSAQFAGLIVAKRSGLYKQAGLDVELIEAWTNVDRWAKTGAGREPDIVARKYENDDSILCLGCVEQNVLVESQARGVKVKAVDAMIKGSVLALAASPSITSLTSLRDLKGRTIGVHADSVDLITALTKNSNLENEINIVEIDCANKYKLLADDTVQAIQAYDVMEPLEFSQMKEFKGREPLMLSLGKIAYGNPGYSQVIFAPNDAIFSHKDTLDSFLEATREGWAEALKDVEHAGFQIMEARKESGTYSKSGQQDSQQVQTRCLELMGPHIGHNVITKVSAIDPKEWGQSNEHMASIGIVSRMVPLEASLQLDL